MFKEGNFEVLLDDVIESLGPGAYLKHSRDVKLKFENVNCCYTLRCPRRYFYNGLIPGAVTDILSSRP